MTGQIVRTVWQEQKWQSDSGCIQGYIGRWPGLAWKLGVEPGGSTGLGRLLCPSPFAGEGGEGWWWGPECPEAMGWRAGLRWAQNWAALPEPAAAGTGPSGAPAMASAGRDAEEALVRRWARSWPWVPSRGAPATRQNAEKELLCDRPGDRGRVRPEGQFEGCGGPRPETQEAGASLSPCSGPVCPASPACLSLSAEDGFITSRNTTAYLKPDLLRVGARQGSCVPWGHSACSCPSHASSWSSARSASTPTAHRPRDAGGWSGRLSRAGEGASRRSTGHGAALPSGAQSTSAPLPRDWATSCCGKGSGLGGRTWSAGRVRSPGSGQLGQTSLKFPL